MPLSPFGVHIEFLYNVACLHLSGMYFYCCLSCHVVRIACAVRPSVSLSLSCTLTCPKSCMCVVG